MCCVIRFNGDSVESFDTVCVLSDTEFENLSTFRSKLILSFGRFEFILISDVISTFLAECVSVRFKFLFNTRVLEKEIERKTVLSIIISKQG